MSFFNPINYSKHLLGNTSTDLFTAPVMTSSGCELSSPYYNGVFDSNEPFALRLNELHLDMCTWDVKNGMIIVNSIFVSFCGGWIFYEHEEKKKKILHHSVF